MIQFYFSFLLSTEILYSHSTFRRHKIFTQSYKYEQRFLSNVGRRYRAVIKSCYAIFARDKITLRSRAADFDNDLRTFTYAVD